MKKIIILLISFTFLVFWSCSKEDGIEQEEYGPGPIIKSNVIINIKNKDGKDLLNPSTAGYLPFEQMKLYYLIKGKKNEDLWRRFLQIYPKHQVKMVWIKGHANIPGNERADQLAVEASQSENLLQDIGYIQSRNEGLF